MKKKSLLYLIILLLFIAICAALGFIYYKDNNSLKTVNNKEIKSVEIFSFKGATSGKKHSYDIKNPEDMKIISNIINELNAGKSAGIVKSDIATNGGTPEHLTLEIAHGKYIDISSSGVSKDQVLVTESSTNKTFKVYSPKLRKLFTDELQRIFNS